MITDTEEILQDKEYIEIISELLKQDKVLKMKQFRQHQTQVVLIIVYLFHIIHI